MKLLHPLSTTAALLACLTLVSLRPPAPASAPSAARDAPSAARDQWNMDPLWYDGLAEKAVYRAHRTIYGTPRSYDATAYTNKQRQDPITTVKSVDDSGLLVFKHHWSECVPTENYDYDYSTACFLEHESLSPYKLAVGTQEDCGASFKQAVISGGRMAWLESVYHPGAGLRQGTLAARDDLQFEDALTLALRGFPFDAPGTLSLTLVPSQKSPKRAPFEPLAATVEHAGVAELELPIGSLRAHRLDLLVGGSRRASYWFAADGSAPWLHVLVRYEGPGGVLYELSEHERTAYWERD